MVNDGGNDDVSSDDSTSDIEDDDDDEFLSLLKTRWSSVKRYLSRHRVAEIFNFWMIDLTSSLKKSLIELWITKINSQVKIQCSVGVILQHKTSHALNSQRYDLNIFRGDHKSHGYLSVVITKHMVSYLHP